MAEAKNLTYGFFDNTFHDEQWMLPDAEVIMSVMNFILENKPEVGRLEVWWFETTEPTVKMRTPGEVEKIVEQAQDEIEVDKDGLGKKRGPSDQGRTSGGGKKKGHEKIDEREPGTKGKPEKD